MLTRTSLTSAALVAGLAGLVFAPAVSNGAWLGSNKTTATPSPMTPARPRPGRRGAAR